MVETDVLTTADSMACDRFAEMRGVTGTSLMRAAGQAVADAIVARWAPRRVLVLCGPGNNGGDGFIAAQALRQAGWPVSLVLLGDAAALRGDARWAFEQWSGATGAFGKAGLDDAELVIDALFGAGLTRPLEGALADLAVLLADRPIPVVAVDLPSGQNGDLSSPDGAAIQADLTVTFNTLKPAHILSPAAENCGEVVVADIGIPQDWGEEIPTLASLNTPEQWYANLSRPGAETHKHRKGRLLVFSGGASSTGAARLAARAGLRVGAGLVTLASPPAAMQVNAVHSTAVMLARWPEPGEAAAALEAARATVGVIGPALGVTDAGRRAVLSALSGETPLVLDADALGVFAEEPAALLGKLRPVDVLTPHVGEFERLFPGLLEGECNKISAVQAASERAGCAVLLKGSDTVIAKGGVGTRVNRHASPALATAGSGDVLAGMIGGFMAQGMTGFDAACAASWLHGDCALTLGEGLIAEDLEAVLPYRLQALHREARRRAACARLTA